MYDRGQLKILLRRLRHNLFQGHLYTLHLPRTNQSVPTLLDTPSFTSGRGGKRDRPEAAFHGRYLNRTLIHARYGVGTRCCWMWRAQQRLLPLKRQLKRGRNGPPGKSSAFRPGKMLSGRLSCVAATRVLKQLAFRVQLRRICHGITLAAVGCQNALQNTAARNLNRPAPN